MHSTPDPAAATQITCCFHGQEGTGGLSALQTICISTCAFTHSFLQAFTPPHRGCTGDDTWRVKSGQTQLGLQDSRDGFHGPQVLSPPVLELTGQTVHVQDAPDLGSLPKAVCAFTGPVLAKFKRGKMTSSRMLTLKCAPAW